MKRLLLTLFILYGSSLNAMSYINKIIKPKNVDNEVEFIRDAIIASDVNTVLHNVKSDISDKDLDYYIHLAKSNFGTPQRSSLRSKLLAVTNMALGSALLYKTVDYFKSEFNLAGNKAQFIDRYKSIHNVLMDFACLSGFISAYGSFTTAADYINPRSRNKKQLLILLYLQNIKKEIPAN